ncbi:MAG: hypothetical protein J6X18_15460 [Bacteroidales bacterium]|nr:hypothetical protein [Bacteroidales bacterium]
MKDYRERYEKLVKSEWFKEIYGNKSLGECPIIIDELEESDDEKIRKTILELVKQSSHILNPMNQKSMIAWLEKQKKTEPQCTPIDYSCVNVPQKDWVEPSEEVNEEEYGIDGLWYAVDILERTIGKVNGYQSDDGILEHECAIAAVKKLKELKSCDDIEKAIHNGIVKVGLTNRQADWLRHILSINLKEWNGEIEQRLSRAISAIRSWKPYYADPDECDKDMEWLNSLKIPNAD